MAGSSLDSSNDGAGTPLSIAASVASLVTFAYAIAASFYFYYRSLENSRANFHQVRERFDLYRRERAVLDRQLREELNSDSRHIYGESSPHSLENHRTEILFKDLEKQFLEINQQLESVWRANTRELRESLVSKFSYYLPLDFPDADTSVKVAFWCALPVYTAVMIILNLTVGFINICLLIKMSVVMARVFTRQEEMIESMRKTEDLFRELRTDALNRRVNQIYAMTRHMGQEVGLLHDHMDHIATTSPEKSFRDSCTQTTDLQDEAEGDLS